MQIENGRVYEGSEPYIFISYAHKDSAKMLPIIRKLQQIGFRIWFDEGIEAGSEWPEYVAEHLLNSSCVLAFITKNAVASPNCRQEINFAIDEEKPLLVIHLEETTLTPGMRMRLNSHQQMFYNRHADVESFVATLSDSVLLKGCKIASEGASKEVTESAIRGKTPLSTVQSLSLQEIVYTIEDSDYGDGTSSLLQEESISSKEPLDKMTKKEPDWTKIFSYSVDGDSVIITGSKYKSCREMIIPKEIGGKSVRVIDRYAFYQCSNLTSVEFPEGLKKIGVGAFERCNLTSVEFPEGLEEIGNDAFRGCKFKQRKSNVRSGAHV